ncbi:MAG: hypothetical protein HY509_03040 [Acidobacteria bacterium]|nr:hypothetical protein [Acidobacteriota bacterium]
MPVYRLRLAFFLLGVLLIVPAGHPRSGEPVPGEDPDLSLAADRNTGLSPLLVTVTGRLEGLPAGEETFCHPGVLWTVWDLDRDLVSRSASDPRCHHLPGQGHTPLVFSRSFQFDTGNHLCRLTVLGSNGSRLDSNFVRIRVR